MDGRMEDGKMEEKGKGDRSDHEEGRKWGGGCGGSFGAGGRKGRGSSDFLQSCELVRKLFQIIWHPLQADLSQSLGFCKLVFLCTYRTLCMLVRDCDNALCCAASSFAAATNQIENISRSWQLSVKTKGWLKG